jgi:hypothetical protein
MVVPTRAQLVKCAGLAIWGGLCPAKPPLVAATTSLARRIAATALGISTRLDNTIRAGRGNTGRIRNEERARFVRSGDCAAERLGLTAPSAKAGYVVDLTQVGSNVVATGSGPIDLTGLSFFGAASAGAFIIPSFGRTYTGPLFSTVDLYTGITGPANFGSGGFTFPDSGSGDFVGVARIDSFLAVPAGYVSDSPLSDTSTYGGQTFATLEATPGRYEWTWGTGANQNFTLIIGTVVPEPSTWAMMVLGFAGLGFAGYRQRPALSIRQGRGEGGDGFG